MQVTDGNTTLTEMRFLEGVVNGTWVKNVSQVRAAKILRSYADTAKIRTWDKGVSAKAVRDYAIVLLGRLDKKA
jgi:hypothetical protein